LPTGAHFAVTTSLGYASVLGTAIGFEPASALLAGVGLRVR
jgi:hypothetical protein